MQHASVWRGQQNRFGNNRIASRKRGRALGTLRCMPRLEFRPERQNRNSVRTVIGIEDIQSERHLAENDLGETAALDIEIAAIDTRALADEAETQPLQGTEA